LTNTLRFFRAPHLSAAAALTLSLIFPAVGHANLLLGVLNFSSGSSNVVIGTDMINFGLTGGTFDVTPSTGTFSTLNGTTGTILNIDNPPYVINTTFATPDFLTFAIAPNISVTLDVLLGGVNGTAQCLAAPAPGQICTPPNSPYNLANTAGGGSTASFVVSGVELDSSTGTSIAIGGIFTAQFTVPYQTIEADVSGTGTINTSYSASFSTVPEPGTGFTLALGTFAMAGFLRFRLRRRA